MARRTKAEAEQTREAILDAAEVLFADRGVGASSLEDIARAAGVTRGAVYWHFKDKLDLFEALYRRAKLPLEQYMEGALAGDDPLQGLRDSCVYALKHMSGDPHARRIMEIMNFRCELAAADARCTNWREKSRTNACDKFEKVFVRARRDGQMAQGVTPKLAASALSSYISGLLNDHLRDGKLDLKRDAAKLIDVFFRGLKA